MKTRSQYVGSPYSSIFDHGPSSSTTTFVRRPNTYTHTQVHNTQLFSIRTALAQQEKSTAAAATRGSGGLGKGLAALFSSSLSGGGTGGGAAALTELFRLPPLLVTVQAFTMNLKGEDCGDWLARLLAAPVRSSGGGALSSHDNNGDGDGGSVSSLVLTEEVRKQQMGLGTLFPSVGCQTLFLPATSRAQLHNLAGACSAARVVWGVWGVWVDDWEGGWWWCDRCDMTTHTATIPPPPPPPPPPPRQRCRYRP
jgi:hypothetical protein